MQDRLGLVGRREEVDYLRAQMDQGGGAVVGGTAGVGKTRLAREVAGRLGGRRVLWASATPAASQLPLGGLSGLGLAPPGPAPSRPGLLTSLAEQLAQGDDEVAVVVDDAHLLDDLSAAFVHHLVASTAVPVLVTIRTGEALPAPIVALYKDEHLPRIELQPLSRRELDDLADQVAGAPLDADSHARLWTLAAGNALFLRELIVDAQASGTLATSPDGLVHWTGRGTVGPRLAELVDERMGRLAGANRDLAEALALGEPLPPDLIGVLVPDADLVDAERTGLVVAEQGADRTEVRLAHPLFGEVVRSRMPLLRRRDLQARLADALGAAGASRPGDVLQIALWRLDSGTADDPDLLLGAARQARTQFDAPLAVRLASASLDLERSFDAGLVLGGALAEAGDLDGALAVLDGLVGHEPDDSARQALTHDRAWIAFQRPGGIEAACRVLEDAERSMADPHLRLFARRDLALLLTYGGRFAEAAALVGPLIESDDEDLRCRALPGVGACAVMAGHHDEALRLCDQVEASLSRTQDRATTQLFVVPTRVNALLLAGRTPEAVELLGQLVDREHGAPLRAGDLGYAHVKLARIDLLHGRPLRAASRLDDALDLLRDADPHRCRVWALSLAAEAHALLGDAEAARSVREQAEAAVGGGAPVFDGDAARARAWVDLCAGESSRARAQLIQAGEDQLLRGQPAFALFAFHDAFRLGARIGPQLLDLAGACDGPWPAAVARHVSAGDDPAALERAAQDFAALPMPLVAAELWSRARATWAAAAQVARSSAAARRVRDQLALSDLASTPLLTPTTEAARLTRREREVASLAAGGLTNAAIADRLVVSIRTVESHLYAAYAKLGISDRTQLTSVIGVP